jgi:hypothetical protein
MACYRDSFIFFNFMELQDESYFKKLNAQNHNFHKIKLFAFPFLHFSCNFVCISASYQTVCEQNM